MPSGLCRNARVGPRPDPLLADSPPAPSRGIPPQFAILLPTGEFEGCMRAAELQKVLWAVDKAAVLVSPQIMERVIRDACHLPSLYFGVPHGKSYVVDRQMLY